MSEGNLFPRVQHHMSMEPVCRVLPVHPWPHQLKSIYGANSTLELSMDLSLPLGADPDDGVCLVWYWALHLVTHICRIPF